MDEMFYSGSIQLFPYSYAPQYWLPCEGQMLSISTYQSLYALLGNTFGGNGSTTFGVPDLRTAAIGPFNKYFICTDGCWPARP